MGVQFLNALDFISIADEKVARVFEAPKAFVQLIKNLQVAGIDADEVSSSFPFPSIIYGLTGSSGRETNRSDGSAVGFIQ